MQPVAVDEMESLEHFDVLIVGAGLSGIGAGVHLQESCPGKSFAVLEARERIGGTWDLFKYPGIRSDSDMYTLGYRFRPWREDKSIADGSSILDYVCKAAEDHRIAEKIRFDHRVVEAEWSSAQARWTVRAVRGETGESVRISCAFLFMCSGSTAVTLVPAMARSAAHVTMLQRSPSYIVSLPAEDPIAKSLRRVLPARLAYPIMRWKNVALTTLSYQLS